MSIIFALSIILNFFLIGALIASINGALLDTKRLEWKLFQFSLKHCPESLVYDKYTCSKIPSGHEELGVYFEHQDYLRQMLLATGTSISEENAIAAALKNAKK